MEYCHVFHKKTLFSFQPLAICLHLSIEMFFLIFIMTSFFLTLNRKQALKLWTDFSSQQHFPLLTTPLFQKLRLVSLLFCQDCYSIIPKTGWLKQQTFIFHNSGGWKAKIKVLESLICSNPVSLALQRLNLLLSSHMAFFCSWYWGCLFILF